MYEMHDEVVLIMQNIHGIVVMQHVDQQEQVLQMQVILHQPQFLEIHNEHIPCIYVQEMSLEIQINGHEYINLMMIIQQ